MSAASGIRGLSSINISLGRSSRTNIGDSLVVGGEPRAHLLPPEIEVQKRGRAQRKGLLVTLVAVLVIVVLGFGAAMFTLVTANASLATEQARASAFAAASGKYAKVIKIENSMVEVKNAQQLGSVGEIDWQSYIASIDDTLPDGMTITTLSAALDPVTIGSTVATTPLGASHIATLTITAVASSMSVSDWLERLRTVKGVVDVNPGAVSLDQATSKYDVDVVVLVNTKALSHRFQGVK
jgi:Tfp pilus assembly protein PilN